MTYQILLLSTLFSLNTFASHTSNQSLSPQILVGAEYYCSIRIKLSENTCGAVYKSYYSSSADYYYAEENILRQCGVDFSNEQCRKHLQCFKDKDETEF